MFCYSKFGHEYSCPCLLRTCAGVSFCYISSERDCRVVEYGNDQLSKIKPKWLTNLRFRQQYVRDLIDLHLPQLLVLLDLIFVNRMGVE